MQVINDIVVMQDGMCEVQISMWSMLNSMSKNGYLKCFILLHCWWAPSFSWGGKKEAATSHFQVEPLSFFIFFFFSAVCLALVYFEELAWHCCEI